MDWAGMYEQFAQIAKSGGDLAFWQDFYFKFYQAFIYSDRWLQYLKGVGTTLLVTACALLLGVALGGVVAVIRTAHDQQPSGRRNPLLGLLNIIARITVT